MDFRLARLLEALHPDELGLRDRIAAQVDASMLDEIAAMDYGMYVEENRDGLADLRTMRYWPNDLDVHLVEVLQLARNAEPEDARRHLMRIFACIALVRVRTLNSGPAHSLAPLVASAFELGPATAADALRYLAWCHQHEPGGWLDDSAERPFLTFAVLVLATANRAEPDVLNGLAAVLLEEWEATLVDEGAEWQIGAAPPLLGLRPPAEQRRIWKHLAGRYLVDGADDSDIGRRLARLGDAIRGKTDEATADLRPLFE